LKGNFTKNYIWITKLIHKEFKFENCGLILNHEYPLFGASPDGLITGECCEKDVKIIKCNNDKDKKVPDIKWMDRDESNKWKLAQKSKHYYQVKMKLCVTNKSFCDLVATPVACREDISWSRILRAKFIKGKEVSCFVYHVRALYEVFRIETNEKCQHKSI